MFWCGLGLLLLPERFSNIGADGPYRGLAGLLGLGWCGGGWWRSGAPSDDALG